MPKALVGFILGALTLDAMTLDEAYTALRAKNYEEAVQGFSQAAKLDPARASIRKDLAYTLLKIGETEAARDQFAEAMTLDPTDDQVALEYAFLCYETKQQITARRVFDRLRKSGNPTAAQAFENVDRPLREGIARWKQALELSPDNFSAHEELARLAEQRDDLDLAAEQYRAAWKLRPARRDLLVDLGRVWQEQGRTTLSKIEDARAAFLAASRGAEPRIAEQARELLPLRYPYVYEFENALALDPSNEALRRELAYLHLEMGNKSAAERQLQSLPDRPEPAAPPPDDRPRKDNKLLGEQSLDKGYLGDALRYLHAAHENDPMDFEVMLKLGWAYNILKDDREAVRWFSLARNSPDAKTAAEASKAYGNLNPALKLRRTTVWMFPTVSTRWRDTFFYAQAKTELQVAFPVHPYVSLRFIGDARGAVRLGADISPQNLSESSVIVGIGLASTPWRGLMAWFEAGEALRYLIPHGETGTALPDYRGGISYAHVLRGPRRLFAETNDDGVFISRFGNDSLLYSQNRTGRSFGESVQVYWNWNATIDATGEYWANTVETGPGVRFRLNPLQFTVNVLRGAYLVNQAIRIAPTSTICGSGCGMRSLISGLLCVSCAFLCSGAMLTFHVAGDDSGGWPAILTSIGLQSTSAHGDIEVIPASAATAEPDWAQRVERGTILILEGASPLAASFGFRATTLHVSVQSVEDLRAPQLRIIWEQATDVPVIETGKEIQVFARERHEKAPLVAGFRRGLGAVLWIATAPGPHGYDRFPYLPQALADLGLMTPFRSARLWAFFDSSYRSRVDLDYFAPRWRQAGIAALHVAAWHYWESDPQADEYLRRLIEACHRNAIQVYAWVELPHVSERFWDQHPEWREKTALLQDAQLDWRKLINLTNRAAFAEAALGLRGLIDRFDWDGVNLAELYFESLEGHDNPARFTPMNSDVRAEFQAASGIDPLDLFKPNASAPAMARFLEFRADLARRQQAEWIVQVEDIRKTKSWLDLTLTHVDDRFDTTMREKIGADTSKTLPLLAQHDFTFLIEDPATMHLGPQRYPQIAARYQALTARTEKLAVDINIVERYQDVYPTKQQTGSELFALLHVASAALPRVAVYFENSILAPDLPLLPSAAASVQRAERASEKLVVESRAGVGTLWTGPALVDGRPWPVASDTVVWLAPGSHSIQPAAVKPVLRLLDLNAGLDSASAIAGGIEFTYHSSARALAAFEALPAVFQIDGTEAHPVTVGNVAMLPRGQHVVTALK